ncbi:MAG TPA: type II toxin-antitoxin system VapC family toxin [Solirubrobacteraceae bacterium]|nr:type II toxin-antitoxin system VapC family toxin [Solirubrobacteraceae bacterium]
MRLALDTNAYASLSRGDVGLAADVRRAEAVGLPVVVLAELWFGFLHGTKLRENTAVLERFLATPRVQVLQIGEQTARTFGEIATLLRRAGSKIQQNDIWIAALCKQHGFALATRDRDFHHVLGLEIVEVSPPA